MEARDLSHLNLPDVPVGIPPSFDEQINLMFDMVALAYQANLTRVFTFMMAAEVSGPDLQPHRRVRTRSSRCRIIRTTGRRIESW